MKGTDEGATSYNGPRQKLILQPKIIAIVTQADEAATVIPIRVTIPDSRLRVKITVIFVADGAQPDLTGNGNTIWLAATEQDQSGKSGRTVPVTDVEGTQAAPTAFPASAGLCGYSREFVTSADYIEGEVTLFPRGDSGEQGVWVLQVRVQPEGIELSHREWDEIRRECSADVLGPVLVI